jgi:hypothetical protein
MTKTNAQRQAAYRARHLQDENGQGERLNIVLDLHAKMALERLAACYGVTQRAVLEQLLVNAENAMIDQLATVPNGQSDYYDRRLRLSQTSLTQ